MIRCQDQHWSQSVAFDGRHSAKKEDRQQVQHAVHGRRPAFGGSRRCSAVLASTCAYATERVCLTSNSEHVESQSPRKQQALQGCFCHITHVSLHRRPDTFLCWGILGATSHVSKLACGIAFLGCGRRIDIGHQSLSVVQADSKARPSR